MATTKYNNTDNICNDINLQGDYLERVTAFTYLGSSIPR